MSDRPRSARELGPPPNILVQVTSAGENPWLEIEELGQRSTWASSSNIPANVRVLWVEGDPSLSRRMKFVIANWVMGLYHRSFWWPLLRINLRKIWPFGLLVWGLNAVFRRRRNPIVLPKIELLDLTLLRRSHFERSTKEPKVATLIRRNLKRAGSPTRALESDRMRLGFPNSNYLAPLRGVLALEYVLDSFEFDYLVRTVSTSYLDVGRMSDQIDNLPRTGLYAGPILELAGFAFVGGSLQVLSRDVVEQIVEYSRDLRLDVYDDVGLGRLVKERKIADFTRIDEIALRNLSEARFEDFDVTTCPDVWAYRCKVERVTGQSEPVVNLMRQLHLKLRETPNPHPT